MLKKLLKTRLFKRKKDKEGVVESTTIEKEQEVLREINRTLEKDFPGFRPPQDEKRLKELRNTPITSISLSGTQDEEENSYITRSAGGENSALLVMESNNGTQSDWISPTEDFYSEISTFSDDYCGLDKVLRSRMADTMVGQLEEGLSSNRFHQQQHLKNVDVSRELMKLNITPELRRFYDSMMRKAAARKHLSEDVAGRNGRKPITDSSLAADDREAPDIVKRGYHIPKQIKGASTPLENQKEHKSAVAKKSLWSSKVVPKNDLNQNQPDKQQPQQANVLGESSWSSSNINLPQPKDCLPSQQNDIGNNTLDSSKTSVSAQCDRSDQDAFEKSKFLTIRGWKSSPIVTVNNNTIGGGAESILDTDPGTSHNNTEFYTELTLPVYSDMSLRAESGDQSGPLKFLSSLKIASKPLNPSNERQSNSSIQETHNTILIPEETVGEDPGINLVDERQQNLCQMNGFYEDAIAKLQALFLPPCCNLLLDPGFHVEQCFQTVGQDTRQQRQTKSFPATIVYNLNKPDQRAPQGGANPINPHNTMIQPKQVVQEQTNAPIYTQVSRVQPKVFRLKKEVLKRAVTPPRKRNDHEPYKLELNPENLNYNKVFEASGTNHNNALEVAEISSTEVGLAGARVDNSAQTQRKNDTAVYVVDRPVIEIDHEEMNVIQETWSSQRRSSLLSLNPISDDGASNHKVASNERIETGNLPIEQFISHVDADQIGSPNAPRIPMLNADKNLSANKSEMPFKTTVDPVVAEESKSVSTQLSPKNIGMENVGITVALEMFSDRVKADESNRNWHRDDEDSSTKFLSKQPDSSSEKDLVNIVPNPSKEKPRTYSDKNSFQDHSCDASIESLPHNKSMQSQFSRDKINLKHIDKHDYNRDAESEKSRFSGKDARSLSSRASEQYKTDDSFQVEQVNISNVTSADGAGKVCSSYEGSNTTDIQTKSTASYRNGKANESQGGFTSKSCPATVQQREHNENVMVRATFRDDQLLHISLQRSMANLDDAKRASRHSWIKPRNTELYLRSGASSEQGSSKYDTTDGQSSATKSSRNERALASSSESIQSFSHLAKIEADQSTERTMAGIESASGNSHNKNHERNPSSAYSTNTGTKTSKSSETKTYSDMKSSSRSNSKGRNSSYSVSSKIGQTSRSEASAQKLQQRSKSLTPSRSSKMDDRRSLSTLKSTREQPMVDGQIRPTPSGLSEREHSNKPGDPYISATFFMNAEDYDGSTLTTRGHQSRITKNSGDDRDVSTLTMNDSSVVDPWQEITEASRVIVKAINRIETVKSEDTDYESTADQVEYALQTLHTYAYSLGIKERELLLLAVNNDGGDDTNSDDAREAFAADLLNFLRRNMDPAELEVRLMQSYDS